jgi:hypothetical protein
LGVCRDDEGGTEIGSGEEIVGHASRHGQCVRMPGDDGSGIVRALPQRSTTSSAPTRNRHTSITRGRIAKPPSRRGGRASGRSRGGSTSAGINRLSASSSAALSLSPSTTSTSLSWANVHQEQGIHSSIQHRHNPPQPQQGHPLDLTNTELSAQDMLLGLGTGSGDFFGAPAPDPEAYAER